MNLDARLNDILNVLLGRKNDNAPSAEQLIHTLDLTLLDKYASTYALQQLGHKAQKHDVAAVCVYSQHLNHFTNINLATVVNFPQGTADISTSIKTIEAGMSQGAQEIDYVLPYTIYLKDAKKQALNHCRLVSDFCIKNNLTLKIILETGAFPEIQQIYEVSSELLDIGCNFLKTSTGKISQGASLAAVFAMLCAIQEKEPSCGIKISGGVKTPLQAYSYVDLAQLVMNKKIHKDWFRIGASSLLDELVE